MRVKITVNDHGNPPGKVADAELIFEGDGDGVLAGLKLIGFGVWERPHNRGELNVTFPARQYSVNGERRSFALLRPVDLDGQGAHQAVKQAIIDAYRAAVEVANV
jgi:hypothetical protein